MKPLLFLFLSSLIFIFAPNSSIAQLDYCALNSIKFDVYYDNILSFSMGTNYSSIDSEELVKSENIGLTGDSYKLGFLFNFHQTVTNIDIKKVDTNKTSFIIGLLLENSKDGRGQVTVENYPFTNGSDTINSNMSIELDMSYYKFLIPLGVHYPLFENKVSINGALNFGLIYYYKSQNIYFPTSINDNYYPVTFREKRTLSLDVNQNVGFCIDFNFDVNLNLNIIHEFLDDINLYASFNHSLSRLQLNPETDYSITGINLGLKYRFTR